MPTATSTGSTTPGLDREMLSLLVDFKERTLDRDVVLAERDNAIETAPISRGGLVR